VPVESIEALPGAISERTRLVVLCNPNDPTGAYLPAEAVASLAAQLPERVHLLVDEALVHFQEREEVDAVLRLTDALPQLLVFRTFSKIYGLSGLRAGYAVGSTASTSLLDAISPVLGVNALTQSAVDQALKIGGPEVERRRRAVIDERSRLLEALRDLRVEATDSQANFVWMSAEGLSGAELAGRLRRDGVLVAPGGPLGADDHVRATVRNAPATDRLLAALRKALGAD
jgi:histidinol-phosphate aminotransferase